MSKDKKTFKAKIKAQNGYTYPDLWQREQASYNRPQVPTVETMPLGYTTQTPVTNDPMMEIQPLKNSSTSPTSSSSSGNNFSSIASGIGQGLRAAGQAMSAVTTGGPQLINALLPNQSLERIDRSLPRNYNPFPQGTGSQAIYEDGGYINPYTTRTRRQNNIVVTEEIPAYTENSFIPMEPIRELSQRPRTFNEVSVPVPIPARNISYDRMLDIQGNPTAYLPVFQGFSRNEAMQALPQLPEYTGGLPVIRSDYGDYFQNFMPGTTSEQWSPYDNQVQMFETGGSIHIDPAKRGSLRRALGVPEGQNIPLSDLEIKDTDSASMIKKKTFARNSRKWDKKQNGGFIQGDELDLTPSEVQQLLSQGYQVDIL